MPKLKALLSLIAIVLFQFTQAQNITFYGNLKQDSTQKNALPNTLLMLIKFKDSTLINHSRSNINGIFKPIKVPLDT